jgi:hypothetical protein
MNDETPRPKRKRRRWIVAGVLLFVAGVAGWWYWPRGDQRLVGRWRVVFPNWNTLNANKSPVREYVLTLRRNGTGSLRREDMKSVDRFRWRFDGKTLVLGEESPARYTSRSLQGAAWIYEKLTGDGWMLAPCILTLKDLGADSIWFDESKSKTPWTIDMRPIVPSRMSRLSE